MPCAIIFNQKCTKQQYGEVVRSTGEAALIDCPASSCLAKHKADLLTAQCAGTYLEDWPPSSAKQRLLHEVLLDLAMALQDGYRRLTGDRRTTWLIPLAAPCQYFKPLDISQRPTSSAFAGKGSRSPGWHTLQARDPSRSVSMRASKTDMTGLLSMMWACKYGCPMTKCAAQEGSRSNG
jgi:hypothetical protein